MRGDQSRVTSRLRQWSGGDPSARERLVPIIYQELRRMTRRILVGYSRRRGVEKRDPGATHLRLDDALSIPVEEQSDLLALYGALEQLAAFDAGKCQVVEMRFFAGLTARIAAVLKTGEAMVRLDWVIGKAWLFRYLEGHARA